MSNLLRHGGSYLGLYILIVMTGCSSENFRLQQYRELESDSKALFLDIFPDMDSGQKTEYLGDPKYLATLRYSRILRGESKRPLRKPLAFYIEPNFTQPISEGHSIQFNAYVDYPQIKHINVTSDVIWASAPFTIKMVENELKVDCIHSDVTVSASFYDEIESTQTIHFLKPLKALEVHLAETSSIVDSKDLIKLNSTAICQDDTTQDISCQSLWQVDHDSGKFLGCGQFIPSSKSWHDGIVNVTLVYGGFSTTRRIYLPNRLPHNK